MSQELREHVNEVLREADTSSDSLVSTDEADEDDDEAAQTDLLETAAKATDLLESADPDDLLEAVGLDTLPDGTEPDSIPEAITQGDPEHVEALQRLVALSKLADRDDGEALEGAVSELQESIGDGEQAADSDPAGESEDGDGADAGAKTTDEDMGESESDDDGARETIESAAETVSEASGLDDVLEHDEKSAGDESDSDGADTSSAFGEQLRSAMESSVDGIGDDLESLRDRLEEASADAADGESESETEDEASDDEADADEDDGLLDAGLGSNQDRDTSGGSGTRYSTMAPPPSERADMKGTARHSTMPDKN